jgi:flavodoxin
MANVLVLYYTRSGNTKTMTRLAAAGAKTASILISTSNRLANGV